jgi:dehydrogenase/reductase SDR family member 12
MSRDGATALIAAIREIASVATYPAIGHRMRRRGFRAGDLDVDLRGEAHVVTGGSAGIGLAIAKGLARRGATVVIVCRDEARGRAAERAIAAEGGRAEVELADVASVAAVRALAERILARHDRVRALVDNAGVSLRDRRVSVEGLEMTFATNVLGGFAMLSHLLPALARAAESAPARVVHVSSAAIYPQRLDVDALLARGDRASARYQGAIQYANTKRAQVELHALLAPRLGRLGITSAVMHPGLAATPGTASAAPLYHRVFAPVLRDPEQGADTAIWLAASPSALGQEAEIWFDRAPRPAHVVPWTRAPRAEAERLFEACADLVGVDRTLELA